MVDRVMGMVKRMVRDCGTGVRSMEANMVATRQLKREAPKQVRYNSQVAYYNHMSEVEAAAKTQKVKLHVSAVESDRPSAPLRLTSIGGNQRALALADAYCDVPLAGDPPLDSRIADVGKAFHVKHVHGDGTTPELGKGSIPVSYKHMQPVSGEDIGFCKGIKFDKLGGKHLSANDARDVACAAPSAVILAFATAAIALETGHVARR